MPYPAFQHMSLIQIVALLFSVLVLVRSFYVFGRFLTVTPKYLVFRMVYLWLAKTSQMIGSNWEGSVLRLLGLRG